MASKNVLVTPGRSSPEMVTSSVCAVTSGTAPDTFTGTVLLNGKFQGEIASPDTLIIGERAVVNATVRTGTLVVNGELVGNVHASERVELTGKARVFGDLESPVIVLNEGVMFEGHCRMPKAAAESTRDASVVSLTR